MSRPWKKIPWPRIVELLLLEFPALALHPSLVFTGGNCKVRSRAAGQLTGNLRNRRSQVRILSGALKIWLSDCDRGQPA